MYEPVQKCTHCGAGLSLDDLRLPNCKYCKTVFPHRAQAEQHAQMANQVMGQMMQQQAQIQNQWRGAFGVGPIVGPGGPPGGPPPGMPANPYAGYQAGMAQANAMSKMVTWIIIGSVAVALLITIGAAALVFIAR